MKKTVREKTGGDYARIFYAVMIILFSVLAVQSASAKLSCSIVYDSADTLCSPEQTVLRIYDNSSALTKVSDRHVLPYDNSGDGDYNLKVCCTGEGVKGHDLSGGVVLRTYNQQDNILMKYGLHVEQNDQNSYDYNNVYFGTKDNSVECTNIENGGNTTNGGCDSTQGYSCIVKLYQSANSHTASCDDPAPDATTSVCCRQNVDVPGWNIQGDIRPSVTLESYPIDNGNANNPITGTNTKAVKINASESSDYAGIRSDKIINIKPNQVYEASVYVYIPTDSDIDGSWTLEIHVDDNEDCIDILGCHQYVSSTADPGAYNNYTITATSIRGEWVKLVRRIKTDSTANLEAKVFFITGSTGGKGTVYVDGFNFVEMNGNENLDELIPYQSSEYNYGCCAQDECWTGVEDGCEDTTDLSTGTPEPNPRCLASGTSTEWSIPFKKTFWFNLSAITMPQDPSQMQYCPLKNQCWNKDTEPPSCFFTNQSSANMVCNPPSTQTSTQSMPEGNENLWRTRTMQLLANLMKIGKSLNQNDYTIECDNADCFSENPANPSACANFGATCVYRSASTNTVIIGVLADRSDDITTEYHPEYQCDSIHGSDEQLHAAAGTLNQKLGIMWANSLSGEPPKYFKACYTDKDYFTKADIYAGYNQVIKSGGWNNFTKEIILSNKDIEAEILALGNGADTSIIEQELGEFKHYIDNPAELPVEMSNNGPSSLNLLPVFQLDKFYNTVFFHRKGSENITTIIEKEGNIVNYLGAFYRGANLDANTCQNIEGHYVNYSIGIYPYYIETLPVPATEDWFNCYLDSIDKKSDTFALLNSVNVPEIRVYDNVDPLGKTFAIRFWLNTTKAFRQFDKCVYDYTYQNASVPPENYTYALTNQYLPFSNPTAEGCCNNNTCWNGFGCASNFDSDKVSFSSADLLETDKFYGDYNAGPEQSYVCRANATKTFGSYEMGYSVWNKVYKKDKWDYSNYGYCLNNTQCWNGTACMESGSVQGGNYCLGGNWTSMTHATALTLLNFTETRYGKDAVFTFECGDASPLAKFTGASVCNYYNYDKSKWAFAFALPADSDPNIGPTEAILDAFGMNTAPSDPSTEYDVFQIDPAYNGPIQKLFWDSKLKIAVVTNDIGMNAPETHVNFFKKIWYWFTTLLGIRENNSAPEMGKLRDMLQNSENFKGLFYMQNNRVPASIPMTTIEALRADYDSLGNNYTAIIYNNASAAEVCKAVNNTAWYYIPFPKKTNLPKVLNCTNTTTIAGNYNYQIFIVHNSTLAPNVQEHRIDTLLWKDQTYRFENFSSCSNDTYHVASLPERIRNSIIGPSEYILYNHSSMTSCCFNTTSCWTGQFCEKEWNMVNYSFVSDENLFVCENGTWTNATRHYDWEDISSEYCAQPTQCYLPGSAYNRENSQNFGANYELQYSNFKDRYLDGRNCTKSNFVFYHDRYCLEGNWTTRTGMLAAELLNFTNKPGITNYSLHCDVYNATLNTVDYSIDGGNLVNEYLSGLLPASGIMPTNNFCVLRYKDGSTEKAAVGTSLNNKTTVSEFLGTTIAASLAGACNGDETEMGFADCNSDGKIWLNNRTQTIVYNKDSMALEPYTGMQAFLQFLSNPAKSIMDFIRSIFRSSSEVPTEVFDYNRYYNINAGNMTVVGYVRNKDIDDRYIVVTYDNTTAFICDSVFRYNNTLNCTGSSWNFNVSGADYNLMNKIFPDLTAKIRPKR